MNTPTSKPTNGCQIYIVPHISEGKASSEPMPIRDRVKLLLKRILTPQIKRNIKRVSNRSIEKLRSLYKDSDKPTSQDDIPPPQKYNAGDLVRIRSIEEIEATLNLWGEFKNCAFMKEMQPYCGTTHKIFRSVARFVDERDYQVKRSRGLYLLEDVICEGTEFYGRCDRACFFFWREEWLEKV